MNYSTRTHKHGSNAYSQSLALESRLVFDGAIVPTAADATSNIVDAKPVADPIVVAVTPISDLTLAVGLEKTPVTVDYQPTVDAPAPAFTTQDSIAVAISPIIDSSGDATASTLIVVDPRVSNAADLLANPPANTQVISLDISRDGFLQVADLLQTRNNITKLDVLAWTDSNNSQWLGSQSLSSTLEPSVTTALTQWGDGFANNANIIFHGADNLGTGWLAYVDALTGAQANWSQLTDFKALTPAFDTPAVHPATSVVFIDAAVRDSASIISAIDPSAEIVYINDQSSGIEQIANYLNGRTGLNSIQIISHANEATLILGNESIKDADLSHYATQLAAIGHSLSNTGNILLYGCDLAKAEDGAAFINHFAALTGAADVSASTDTTGAADKGGNWVLEYNTGVIDTRTIVVPDFHDFLAAGVATNVSSVAISSTPAVPATGYTVGEVVQATVTFTGAEIVTGTPSLELNVGGNIRYATYTSGSGTANLVFSYTIVPGDVDANGIAVNANSLRTDGGSINNGSTAPVAATLINSALPDSVGNNVAAAVAALDTTAPVFRSAVGSGSTITLSYDEIGSGLNAGIIPAASDFAFSINGGVGPQLSVTSVTINHTAQTVSLGLNNVINTTDTNMSVSYTPTGVNDLQDVAGNKPAGFSNVYVANTMPVFNLNYNGLAFDAGTVKVGTGTGVGDKILFSNAVTINGQTIDVLVTITALTNANIVGTDTVAGTLTPPLAGTPPLVDNQWFDLNTDITGVNGSATLTFDFIKSGTYGTTMSASTGEDVILQNVPVNSYDIDGLSAGQNQFQEFGGFATYTVSSTTTLAQTQLPGFTHFQDTSSVNNLSGGGTVSFDNTRVQALYGAIHEFQLKTGAIGATPAYYYLDFSTGPNWVNPANVYQIPTVNPRITNNTTPDLTGTFVGTVTNSTDQAYQFSIVVNGVTYTANTRSVAGNTVTLTNALTGLTAVFDLTTGAGTWSLTVPTPLLAGTYDVAAIVDYGSDLTTAQAPGHKFTTDKTTNELTINAVPADTTPPTLLSFQRLNPPGGAITPVALAAQNYVDFKATFSEPVTNVDVSDFQLSSLAGSVAGLTISSITQTSPTTYTVRVSNIPPASLGTINLDLTPSNDLVDLAGNLLGGLPANLTPSTGVDETYTISAVNNPPVNTLPATPAVPEAVQTPITGLSVADPNNNLSSVVVTVGAGSSLNFTNGGGTAVISANNTNIVTITGTQANINVALATLKYTSKAGITSDTLNLLSTDSTSLTDNKTMNITVNNPPVNTLPASPTVTATVQTPITGLSVADPNNNLSSVVVIVGAGSSLNFTNGGGTAVISANNTNSVTITGTQADINLALATLKYTSKAGISTDTLNLLSTDGTSLTDNKNMNITVNTTSITAVDGNGVATGQVSVFEKGLVAPSDNSQITTGTLTVTTPNGMASVTIAGQTFTVAQLAAFSAASPSVGINTGKGTLIVTGFVSAGLPATPTSGTISYQYTLNAPQNQPAGATESTDDITLAVTDSKTTATATGKLTVSIVNDVPTANPGHKTINAGTTTVTGNVFSPTYAGDIPDRLGADITATPVTSVSFGATKGTIGSPLNGLYGSLKLNADGTYSYALDNANPVVKALNVNQSLSEVFNYTITDSDGNSSSTTLTIIINGINKPPIAVADTVTATSGQTVTIPVLDNDRDPDNNLDASTVKIVGTANTGDSLVVAGQGIWSVNPITGGITFSPFAGFTSDPTPISYTVHDKLNLSSVPTTVTVHYQNLDTLTSGSLILLNNPDKTFDSLITELDKKNLLINNNLLISSNNVPFVPLSLYPSLRNYVISLTGSLRDQVVLEKESYSFSVTRWSFRHTDPEEQLAFEASRPDGSSLPDWIKFNPQTLKFSGVPPKGANDERIMITAKDTYGNEVHTVFTVHVNKEHIFQGDTPVKPAANKLLEKNRLGEKPVAKTALSEQIKAMGKLNKLTESRALLDSLKHLQH